MQELTFDDVLYHADVTVLGIGNVILRDEGFGVRVAEYLSSHYTFPEGVQVIDGGTLGIELTQYVTGTKKLLVIDTVEDGAAPGTMFRFENEEINVRFQKKISSHDLGIQDLLAFLEVTGKKIEDVVILGVQPADLEAGVGLSPTLRTLVAPMAERAVKELSRWGVGPEPKAAPEAVDDHVVAEESAKEEARSFR